MDYINSLIHLVRINSVCEVREDDPEHPYGEDVRRALDYVLDLCRSFGFRTRNCDNRIGYAEIGEGDPLTGILVHLDVVPPGEGWTAEQGEIRNGRLYGRGVIDDKGPAAACIYAMKDILESGEPVNGRIRIIFGQAEETGIWSDMDYYLANEEHPVQGFTPDAMFPLIYAEKGLLMITLTADAPDCLASLAGGSAVNVVPDSCKAELTLPDGGRVSVCTAGKSAHASMPEEGINAISLMMKTLYGIVDTDDQNIITFYHDCIGMNTDGRDFIGAEPDELSGPATVNPGVIRLENGRIELKIDIRYPVNADYDEIINRIDKTAKTYEMTWKADVYKEPVHLSLDNAFAQGLLAAYRSVTGDSSGPISIGGGTYARAMKNILAFGPVLKGREMTEHEPDEYIYLEDLYLLREIYRKALREATKMISNNDSL